MYKYNKVKGKQPQDDHIAGISCSSLVLNYFGANDWIVDTGATDHMCSNLNIMHDLHNIDYPIHVSFPNGTKVSIIQIGTVSRTPSLYIHNVFYVPSFHYNLLSISRIAQDSNLTMIFSPTHCILWDQH